MAFIKTDGSYMGLPMNIARGNPIPLDTTEIWYDFALLEEYAKSGLTAYVGQIVQYVDTNAGTATAYIIANENGDLVEVGSATIGDNKTIELSEDGVLRLVGTGDSENPVEVGAQLVMGDNGTITWVMPDTTTVEGLNTAVDALQKSAQGHETRLTTAESDIVDLKATVSGLGGIFNFAGSMSQDDFANENASDYQAGDVILVDGAKEYVCVELEDGSKRWEVLGDPSGVTALEGRVDALETWQSNATSNISSLETKVTNIESDISDLEAKDTAIDEALATKASNADLTTAIGRIAVNEQAIVDINAKNNSQDTAINERATITYVDNKVTDINTAIAKKADQSALQDVIDTMATDSELAEGLGKKVDTTTYEAKVSTLQSAIDTNTSGIASVKATADQNALDIDALETAVGNKADASTVTTLSGKVDGLETTVGSHTSSINTLNGTVTSLDANKADKTTVESLTTRVAANEKAISDHATEYTTLEGRVTTAEGNITKAQETADKGVSDAAAASSAAASAQSSADAAMAKAEEVLGAEGDGASANTVYGAKAAAAAAQDTADKAQGEVDALEEVVNALDSSYKSADSALDTRIKSLEDVIDGVQGAMHFVGISTIDPSTGVVAIEGKDDYSPTNGDVVIYNDADNNSIEYIYSDGSWVELGDVSAEAKRIADLEAWKKDTVTPALDKIPTIEENISSLQTAKANLESRVKAVEDKNGEQDTAISGLDTRLTTAEETIVQNAADIRSELATKATELEGKIVTETTARTNAVTELQNQINVINNQLTWTKMGS